jgi:[acyl-carrier-protein] S-malonyltransferase
MTLAFVFPGQGSQSVGMGSRLAETFSEARETFEEVDQALGQNLFRIMREGPEEELTLTQNAQPALMAVSLAITRVLERQFGFALGTQLSFVGGHSLGEYSALAAAGSLSVSDTARLLRVRGEAMQDAVPLGLGGMAALIGLEFGQARELAELVSEDEVCQIANDNAPGQIVLSGHATAISRVLEKGPEFGARRVIPLQVSAPFHCSLMGPAAEKMKDALTNTRIVAPAVKLIANVTAEPTSDPELITQLLVQQVTGMVRWRESVLKLKELGVTKIIEVGAGNVLCGLIRRIDRNLDVANISDPAEIDLFSKSL